MRWSFQVITFLVFLLPQFATGAVFISGSVNQSTANLGLQKQENRGGSLSVDLGLGQYVRIGITHQQNFKQANGWDEDEDIAETEPGHYEEFTSKEHIMANSLDFTFILYEGELFVPYLKAGAIWKSYTLERVTATTIERPAPIVNAGPLPNLGAGVGIKLNQQFTLKLFHKASPSTIYDPDLGKYVSVWDRDSTVGLTYKL